MGGRDGSSTHLVRGDTIDSAVAVFMSLLPSFVLTVNVWICRYDVLSGRWDKVGWWNTANGVEAITNTMLYTQTSNLTDVLANIFYHQSDIRIISDGSYDDVLWWSLAWARAYELTGR